MIRFGRRPEDFLKDRFQAVGPDLVPLQSWMKLVLRNAVEKLSVAVCQFVIHVEITNLLSVRHRGKMVVDAIDRRDHSHIVIPRKESGKNNDGIWSLLLAGAHQRL